VDTFFERRLTRPCTPCPFVSFRDSRFLVQGLGIEVQGLDSRVLGLGLIIVPSIIRHYLQILERQPMGSVRAVNM